MMPERTLLLTLSAMDEETMDVPRALPKKMKPSSHRDDGSREYANRTFVWDLCFEGSPLVARLPISTEITLVVAFDPGFVWKTIRYDPQTRMMEPPDTNVQVQLTEDPATRFDRTYGGKVLEVAFANIAVFVPKFEITSKIFFLTERHYVVATVHMEGKKKERLLNVTPLGRAQEIITHAYGNSRTYTWDTSTTRKNARKSVSLGALPTITSFNGVADHDGLCNEARQLPVLVPKGQMLTVRFYNQSDENVDQSAAQPVAEMSVTNKTLRQARKTSSRFSSLAAPESHVWTAPVLDKNISMSIEYQQVQKKVPAKPSDVRIIRVTLLAHNYQSSLANKSPRTVAAQQKSVINVSHSQQQRNVSYP